MELRNGSLVGGSPGILPQASRPLFEQGVGEVLRRWTALTLAVENQWGGPSSLDKAERLFQDIVHWFYSHKQHYADDLEVDLADIMESDFSAVLEDDSPREVSKQLVLLHEQLCRGDAAELARLQGLPRGHPSAASRRQRADGEEGEESSSDSSEGGDSDGEGGEGSVAGMEAEAVAQPAASAGGKRGPRAPPVVDDQGFQVVQRRGRR